MVNLASQKNTMTTISSRKQHIIRDLFFIALSIAMTAILVLTGAMEKIVASTSDLGIPGIFIAGIFFTSMFTLTPAGLVLAGLAAHEPILQVAVIGAAGAVIGDLFIYLYVKDALAPDIFYIVGKTHDRRIRHFFHLRIWRWLTPLLGAIVIASPLPDELGLAMMGLSKTRSFLLIPISFTCNFIAILLIGLAINHF